MSNSNKGAANVALSAFLLVVGLGVGFGVSKASNNNTNSMTKNSAAVPTTATNASELRANLVSRGVQHQDLTMHAIDAALDGDKNAADVGKDLYKNGTDIGAAVGSVYGKDAETTFNTVWKLHLDQFVNYAVASSKGDDAGKKAALSTIDSQYTKPLSAYLAKANPNLPQDTLYSVLSDHVTQTADMIDLHVKGDYAGETKARDQAAQHLNGIFSTLAGGIVKQFPDKFQN